MSIMACIFKRDRSLQVLFLVLILYLGIQLSYLLYEVSTKQLNYVVNMNGQNLFGLGGFHNETFTSAAETTTATAIDNTIRTNSKEITTSNVHSTNHDNTYDRLNMPLDNPIIVHNVKTRFMQKQPNLLALGAARLVLFETFCLPTMIGQSTTNFVWVIRTDPNLHPDMLNELKRMLGPYTNRFFLILNMHNGENLRDMDINNVKLASGNRTALAHAIQLSKERTLLETRLDADDGFHTDFMESVQMKALASSYVQGNTNWRVFCSRRTINWHTGHLVDKKMKNSPGILELELHKKTCMTPGLTYALPPNVTQNPEIGHQKIKKVTPKCAEVTDDVASALIKHYSTIPLIPESSAALVENKLGLYTTSVKNNNNNNNGIIGLFKKKNNNKNNNDDNVELPKLQMENCMDIFNFEWPQVVRARTPTSHGMANVFRTYKNKEKLELWNILQSGFHINKASAIATVKIFRQNLNAIVEDNLKGQCTAGHSCKTSTQKNLQWIADKTQKKKKK